MALDPAAALRAVRAGRMALDASTALDRDAAKRISHEAATWALCFEEIKKRVGDKGFSPTDLKEIASTIYISIKRR